MANNSYSEFDYDEVKILSHSSIKEKYVMTKTHSPIHFIKPFESMDLILGTLSTTYLTSIYMFSAFT